MSLPVFHGEQLEDGEGAYDDADEWLNSLEVRNDAQLVATDLQSHRNIRQGILFSVLVFCLTHTELL